MKSLRIPFLLAVLMFLFTIPAHADDFYYNGGVHYNPYNGYTVMSLPPPPPMNTVPFYVRDDYDDYVEDYYECILGYEYKGMTCRYWRKYAEKNGLYQKTPHNAQQYQNGVNMGGAQANNNAVNTNAVNTNTVNQNTVNANTNTNAVNNYPVDMNQANTGAVQDPALNAQPVDNINQAGQTNTMMPYIPSHQ